MSVVEAAREAARVFGIGPWKAEACCLSLDGKIQGYDIPDLHDTGDGECGEFTRERAEALALLLTALPKIVAALEALEYIAHFDDGNMATARTLHYDMRAMARAALAPDS